jgi:O-antigen/teichoic acid export membrane protein
MDKFAAKLKALSTIGAADISATIISALFWLYIASILEPKGYGEISYFLSISMLSANIALLGASNTLVVYTAKNVKIQASLYFMTLISGLVASAVVFFIFYNIGASILVIGYVIFTLVTSELLGRKFFKTYSKYVILQKILMVTLALGFYYLFDQNGVLVGIGLSFTPYIIGIIKGFKKSKIEFSLIKERSGFIINSYIQSVLGTLGTSLDKIIIAPVVGFVLLGNYALGLQYYNLMLIIPTIVTKFLLPEDSTGFANKKLRYLIVLFAGILTVIGLTIGPIVISILFPKFENVFDVIRIISLSLVPSVIVMIYHTKFLGTEKSRKALTSSMIWSITQISGIIILGNIYGIIGVAFALVLASINAAIYSLFADKYEKL